MCQQAANISHALTMELIMRVRAPAAVTPSTAPSNAVKRFVIGIIYAEIKRAHHAHQQRASTIQMSPSSTSTKYATHSIPFIPPPPRHIIINIIHAQVRPKCASCGPTAQHSIILKKNTYCAGGVRCFASLLLAYTHTRTLCVWVGY